MSDNKAIHDFFAQLRLQSLEKHPEPKKHPAVFEAAAKRVRSKIHDTAALFPEDEELAALLKYLEIHLFDFTLDVNAWLSASGCSRAGRNRFVSKLGPLKAYLDQHRVAVAAEVIRKTSAPIEKTGRRVGFKMPRTFQRTFERVIGVPPLVFRSSALAAKEANRASMPDVGGSELGRRPLAIYWRRQVMLRLLDSRRTVELRNLLRRHYEFLRQSPSNRDPWRGEHDPDPPLLTGDDLKLRSQANRATEKAIDHDAQRTPELERLFFAIIKHLFEPKLKLDKIRTSAGFHQNSIWRQFTEFTGQTPWSYVRDARLETAAMLLLLTSLPLTKTCRLVGYSSRATFHHLFRDFAGLGATEYRRRARAARRRGGPLPCSDAEAPDYWKRAVSGQLTVGEALSLDAYLEALARNIAKPPYQAYQAG